MVTYRQIYWCQIMVEERTQPKSIKIQLLSLISGFLIFCIVFKWQPWGYRLQLPIFLFGSVAIALFLDTKNKNVRIINKSN